MKVNQAEVDALITKPISKREDIHSQFRLFACAPRTILPDSTLPVGYLLIPHNTRQPYRLHVCKMVDGGRGKKDRGITGVYLLHYWAMIFLKF